MLKRFLTGSFWIFTIFILVTSKTVIGEESMKLEFRTSELKIKTADREVQFTVELAEKPSQWRNGLMYRKQLDPDSGMLFVYRKPRKATMWMKNTYLPLDMIFISENGIVVNIEHNTTPLSLDHIPSKGVVLAVLEVLAGTSEKFGIREGDRVLHPAFIQKQ